MPVGHVIGLLGVNSCIWHVEGRHLVETHSSRGSGSSVQQTRESRLGQRIRDIARRVTVSERTGLQTRGRDELGLSAIEVSAVSLPVSVSAAAWGLSASHKVEGRASRENVPLLRTILM
eukprot:1179860-Prorocentrum_minimum.AAC.1